MDNIPLETPFPEIQRQTEDKTIKEQYQELVAREQREAQAAQNARLEKINSTGDISELLADLSLRIAFNKKFPGRYGQLHLRHLRSTREARQADERAAKMSKQSITTTAGRLRAANDARRAAQAN